MRENRTHGSEGGEGDLPDPYRVGVLVANSQTQNQGRRLATGRRAVAPNGAGRRSAWQRDAGTQTAVRAVRQHDVAVMRQHDRQRDCAGCGLNSIPDPREPWSRGRSRRAWYRVPPYTTHVGMTHTVREKQKLLARVRRIRGQMEAIERALEREAGCEQVMHLLASTRAALAGLTAEVAMRASTPTIPALLSALANWATLPGSPAPSSWHRRSACLAPRSGPPGRDRLDGHGSAARYRFLPHPAGSVPLAVARHDRG